MADLDDFFAKKDRKRGKAAKKYSTPDEIAKKIDDTKQKNETKTRKERLPGVGENDDGVAMQKDEDEWREVEVAKKDYTGLKIQPLAAGEGGGAAGGQGGEAGAPQGAGVPQGDPRQKGPWNKAEQQGGEQAEEPEERPPPQVEAPPRPAPPAPASGSYVPPSMRNRPGGAPEPGPNRIGSRNQKNHAPDIHSEEYFPVLGGEAPVPGKRGAPAGGPQGGAWTEAGGARAAPRAQPERLQLGNRFTSLTHDS